MNKSATRTGVLAVNSEYELVNRFSYWINGAWVKHQYHVVIYTGYQTCGLPPNWTQDY